MRGPMEVEHVSFTVWRWSRIERGVPLESYTFGVDAIYIGTRSHWFMKKTVEFELHGSRVQIVQFIEAKLRDGTCKRIKMGKTMSHKLSNNTGSTGSVTSKSR